MLSSWTARDLLESYRHTADRWHRTRKGARVAGSRRKRSLEAVMRDDVCLSDFGIPQHCPVDRPAIAGRKG